VHRVSGEPHKPAIQTRSVLRVQLAGAEQCANACGYVQTPSGEVSIRDSYVSLTPELSCKEV